MYSPVVIYPDTVRAVIAHLNAHLSVPASRTVPNPRPASFVTVLRTGGAVPDDNAVTEDVQLTIDCWATTHPAAHGLAQMVRALVRSMAGTTTEHVTVYSVREFGGPVDLPDPESTQPRYTMTLLLRVRGEPFTP